MPGEYSYERVEDALADLVHRSLFGRDDTVNVHPRAPHPPRALRFDPLMGDAFAQAGGSNNLSAAGRRTLTALMDAGRQVFAELGYHQTRVDDVVEAAGVSHGAFYRYFENKDQLARILTAGAVKTISVVFAEIPVDTPERPVTPKPVLKRWLRRYNTAQTSDAVMARVWSDAALQDATLRANLAPAFDWGRRKLVTFLEPRALRRHRHRGDGDGGVPELLRRPDPVGHRGRRRRPDHPAGLPRVLTIRSGTAGRLARRAAQA